MMRLDLDPKARVGDLTVAKQQMVEIVRGSIFSVKGTNHGRAYIHADRWPRLMSCFALLGNWRDRGVGIVHISHRMEELKQQSADRVTAHRVLRSIHRHS